MTTFSWLHLTDFHFGLNGQKFLWPTLREKLFDDLEELHKHTGPWQAVLFTGDLVQLGKSEEFTGMQQDVLGRLWEKLNGLGSGDAVLLPVPGNHDLYRPNPNEDNAAIDRMLEIDGFNRIAAKFWDNPASPYRTVINDAFAAYSQWWEAEPHRPKDITTGILPGDFACTLDCGDQRIGIVGLNTAFLQLQGGDYQGKLAWDTRQLQAVCGGAVDDWLNRHSVCLLLTHQGPDWLTPEAREHGDSEIVPAGRFGVHFFGHMHEAKAKYICIGSNAHTVRHFQGSSAFGMEQFGEPPKERRSHGYSAGHIKFDQGQANLRIWPRIATDKPNGWRYTQENNNFHLLGDQGTAPEIIRTRQAKPTTKTPQTGIKPIPTAAPSTPHSTLPSRRPFFGRTKELSAIAEVLKPGHRGWGMVLDGAGGMGKTALALEAAHFAPAELYPLKLFITAKKIRLDADGAHELQHHRVDDFYALLAEIGLGLGRDDIQRQPQSQWADLVRHALAAHRVLLVLDNLESFPKEQRREIYGLLENLPPACRAIVTSRRRDETAARTLRLDQLDIDAARQLLADLGKHHPPIAKLTDQEQRQLYAETGGNPLLLTWTATQLGRAQGRCRTVDEAAQRLKEAHRPENTNNNDPLEFVFGDLLDTFTDDETAMLAALAYFTEPAPLSWLLPLANLSQKAAETALDDLRDRALLFEDDVHGTWLFPRLTAHYLRLRRPEVVGAVGQRLEAEAYALAMQHGYIKNAPFTGLEAVWPTVEAALPLLVAGDNARLQKVCDALFQFLNFTGRWDVLLTLNQQAETKALAFGDYHNAGWRAFQAGFVHNLQNEAHALLACAERCAQYWRQAGSGTYEQAAAIRLRGMGHSLLEDYPAAITAYQQALELNRSQNPESEAMTIAFADLANAKIQSGDLDDAEANYREALRIADKLRYREGIANYTCNLAGLYLTRKDWSAAERLATQALALAKNIGRLELMARSHRTIAQALLEQRQASAALPHAQEAVAIYIRLHYHELPQAEALLAACKAACSGAPDN